MTSQLMMWKRNGKEECGTKSVVGDGWIWSGTEHIYKSEVTDLQPAKAVPLDTITISKELWKKLTQQTEVELSGTKDTSWQSGVKSVVKKILAENPHLDKPTKTYLTYEQHIKVFQSLSDEKIEELTTARYAARYAAWYAAWNTAWNIAWDVAWNTAWYDSRETSWCDSRDISLAIHAKDSITSEQFEILTKPWTSCGLSLYAEDWEEVLKPEPMKEPEVKVPVVKAVCKVIGEVEYEWELTSDGRWRTINRHNGVATTVWSELINPVLFIEGMVKK